MLDENTILEDEISVIKSIYGTEAFHEHEHLPLTYDLIVGEAFHSLRHFKNLKLTVSFSKDYPFSMPEFKFHQSITLENPLSLASKLNKEIFEEFKRIFTPGEEVLYLWLTFLEEYLIRNLPTPEELNVPWKVTPTNSKGAITPILEKGEEKSTEALACSYTGPQIYSSAPIEDRKSVFVAHCAKVHSTEEVKKVINFLLEDRKIAKATHNISAYRILNSDNTVNQDNDDDGETAAGSRLQHLLQVLNVKNVLVVVSRWYGGIQLGPDRFKHINNAARNILEERGFINHPTRETKANRKRN